MTSKIIYNGELRTTMTHLQSGTAVITDAPVDNHGKGEAFSPTDLVATAYGSCMMTVMGIKARQMELDLTGTEIEITKVMYAEPRRIGEIHAKLTMPKHNFTDKDKAILENTARTCPVELSLHPDLKRVVEFVW
jgi:putative redox protein